MKNVSDAASCCNKNIHSKPSVNSIFAKCVCPLFVNVLSHLSTFCHFLSNRKFAKSTVVSLSCCVQIFKAIWRLNGRFRANEIPRELSLTRVSDGYSTLHNPLNVWRTLKTRLWKVACLKGTNRTHASTNRRYLYQWWLISLMHICTYMRHLPTMLDTHTCRSNGHVALFL